MVFSSLIELVEGPTAFVLELLSHSQYQKL